jgi:hypothetical protein
MSATAPLHPVWGKALGLESTALTTSAGASVPAPDASDGWQPVRAVNPRPGAPVAIKKKLRPLQWISTIVRPGDPRYPSAHHA